MSEAKTEIPLPLVNGKPVVFGVIKDGNKLSCFFADQNSKRAILGVVSSFMEQLRMEAFVEGLAETNLIDMTKFVAPTST